MLNQAKTILLLGVLTALLVGIGGALGRGYLYLFTAFAIVMNIGAYYFSDRMVLAMHHARPIPPEELPWLHRMIADLAERAGIPVPRVYMIPSPQANAFATGRNPRHAVVAVTEGILRLLSPAELRGVLAHEISHVKNRDILVSSVAATLASAITSIAQVLQWTAFFGGRRDDDSRGSGASALLLAIVAPLAATLVQLGISRAREYGADASGARLLGDPEPLASALEKLETGARLVPVGTAPATASLFIVNPFGGRRAFLSLFSTHPPLEERVRRLRRMSV